MNCISCTTIAGDGDKFCSNCGKILLDDSETRSPEDISIDWIGECLLDHGYQFSSKVASGEKIEFVDKSGMKFVVGLLTADVPVITLEVPWSVTKPGWSRKYDFLSAINNMNRRHWLCTFYAPDTLASVIASSGMWIGKKTSKRDVGEFTHQFLTGAVAAVASSEIVKFA